MKSLLLASTVQSLTQHTQHDVNCIQSLPIAAPHAPMVCRWLMAAGKRPVPFRTRKLSPPAPMVLLPGGSGRVGYRRPNNFTHKAPARTHQCRRVPFSLCPDACRTPRTLCCGQPPHHPSLVRTHENPGRNHPAGRALPTRGHIGRGASARSHHDAYRGAKVEHRTSSTLAYTDELDLHHSTNNAPTTTQGRSTLRIADNCTCTNNGCPPTKTRGETTRRGAPCQLGAT